MTFRRDVPRGTFFNQDDTRPATTRHAGLMGKAEKATLDLLARSPSCVAYHSANQAIANNTITTPAFDSEEFDTDAFHDLTTNNGRLTVPTGKDGLYVAVFVAVWAASAGAELYAAILKNGSTERGSARAINAAGSVIARQTVASLPTRLAAGDYVMVNVLQGTGAALNLLGGAGATQFGLYRVGGY